MTTFRTSASLAEALIAEAASDGVDRGFLNAIHSRLTVAVGAALEPGPPESALRRAAWQARELGRYAARTIRRVAAPEGQQFALLLPRMPNHLIDLLPLGEELQRRGHQVLVALPVSGAGWNTGALPAFVLRAAPVTAVARELAKVAPSVARFEALVSHARLGSVDPHALRKAVRQALMDVVPTWASVRCQYAELFERARPGLLLVGNPNILEGRLAVELGRKRGLKTVALQHGAIVPHDPAWRGCDVDRVLVWGEVGRENLLASGLRPGSVRPVGCLRLDQVLSEAKGGKRTRVLVASSGAGHQVPMSEHVVFVDKVYTAAALTPGVEWTVKLHPKDHESIYEGAAQRHPGARVSVTRGDRSKHGSDIFGWLKDSAALVTVVSAAAMDALVAGVPVVSVQPTPDARAGDHEFLSASRVATTGAELAAAVREALEGRWPNELQARAKVLAGRLFSNLGHAVPVAADECERIAAATAGDRASNQAVA